VTFRDEIKYQKLLNENKKPPFFFQHIELSAIELCRPRITVRADSEF